MTIEIASSMKPRDRISYLHSPEGCYKARQYHLHTSLPELNGPQRSRMDSSDYRVAGYAKPSMNHTEKNVQVDSDANYSNYISLLQSIPCLIKANMSNASP